MSAPGQADTMVDLARDPQAKGKARLISSQIRFQQDSHAYLDQPEYVRIYFEGFLVHTGGQGRVQTLGKAFRDQQLMGNDWLIWGVRLKSLYRRQQPRRMRHIWHELTFNRRLRKEM